jgi:hypothetical protein
VPICDFTPRRSGLLAYINKSSPLLLSLFRCNNDVSFIYSPAAGIYLKEHEEESTQATEILAAVEKGQRRAAQYDASIRPDSNLVHERSTPLQLVLRAVRGGTSKSMVGAMMAAQSAVG